MGLFTWIRRAVFRRSEAPPLALPAPAPLPEFAAVAERLAKEGAATATLADVASALTALRDAPDRGVYETAMGALQAIEKASGGSVTEPVGRPGFDIHGGYLNEKERSPDLNGSAKWTTYRNNVNNVDIVGAGTRRALDLAGSPTWSVPAFDAEDPEDPEALERAEFAEQQLRNLATPWRTVTQTAFMSRFNGYTIQVWTARKLPDGRIGLADIAERPTHTIERWEVDADKNLLGVWQRDATTSAEHFIPRERMVFSQDVPLTDSPARGGIYRHVAEPVRELLALRKISRQGFETDLSGIPVIYAPLAELKEKIGKPAYQGGPAFTVADYTAAVQGAVTFTENHVRTKQTGLLFDSGTQMIQGQASAVPRYKFELAAAGGTAHEPVLSAMKDTKWGIAILLGCADLLIGGDGGGSLAMAKVKTADGYRLIVSGLNAWAEVVQRDVLRPLWVLNGWDPETAPLPSWDRLEFEDVPALINALFAALAQFGITGDRSDAIVNYILKRFGLPPLEEQEDDDLSPDEQAAADAAGIGKPRGAGPDGVIEDDEDLPDDPPPKPIGKGRRVTVASLGAKR